MKRQIGIQVRSRHRVLGFAAASLLLVGLVGWHARAEEKAPPDPPADVRAVEIAARPITAFARANPTQSRFGRLVFRGGLVLTSPAKAFGGFSGIALEADGRRVLLISDEGAWLTGEIAYDGERPVGLRNARMGPIRGVGGRALDRKKDLDAEAVVIVEGDLKRGVALIAFERNHRIGRFPVVDGVVQSPTGYIKRPAEARRMKPNKGFEAMTVMRGGPYKGSVIAFSERFPDNPAQHTGWLWVRGEPQRLAFPDIGAFEVTDAAGLADGSLLVLERRFRWTEGVKMRLRRFPAAAVRPGAVMAGETLLEADLGFEIDNMEGLAVHTSPRGETVVTLVSDDNFNAFLQRTVLLQFTLVAPDAATGSR